ncbi:MAG: molybdopterin cofactor-binding domain-containing protein [Sphingomonadaceae bacterium]
MVAARTTGITRRGLLIAGGTGVGLLVAWQLWPRVRLPGLNAAPGEHILGAFLKVGVDGHVTVVAPQVEMGQGVYTTLPQIVADELGADWRTVAVEAAPVNPDYGNALLAEEWRADRSIVAALNSGSLQATGGSTSVRGYEARLRDAGAMARALLCMAAAQRWDADWRACDTAEGFVVRGEDRLRFGEVAAEAARLTPPDDIAWRTGTGNRLTGVSLPRLDLPSKVDGSANYAGDVRLPDMVYAAIAQGPSGDARVKAIDKAAGERVTGVIAIEQTERWVAAVATNWWAASRAIDAMRPRFAVRGGLRNLREIDRALDAAFAEGYRISSSGDVGAAFAGATIVTAEYRTGLAPHAAIEPLAATAMLENGRLQLWIGTQVPGLAVAEAARATGLATSAITVHPMLIGGSFGRRYEVEIAGQIAVLAQRLKRPVQLVWSRAEDMRQDRFRPATAVRLAARLGSGGQITGWLAKVAAPATQAELEARIRSGAHADAAMREAFGRRSPAAVAGALPPYTFPNVAIDHHPARIGIPTGDWRGRAHVCNAFATEAFIDELASVSGIDPFSFRMGLLGGNPRLAQCLSKAAALGGWQGGSAGSGQGLACHTMADSYIAVLAQAERGPDGRVRVSRLVAVVDCGRIINPGVVRQQIAGGLIFGMAAATGARVEVSRGQVGPTRLGALNLPRLADAPQITIELIRSTAAPGGVSELAVPPVAPAIANALYTNGGQRVRSLPMSAL